MQGVIDKYKLSLPANLSVDNFTTKIQRTFDFVTRSTLFDQISKLKYQITMTKNATIDSLTTALIAHNANMLANFLNNDPSIYEFVKYVERFFNCDYQSLLKCEYFKKFFFCEDIYSIPEYIYLKPIYKKIFGPAMLYIAASVIYFSITTNVYMYTKNNLYNSVTAITNAQIVKILSPYIISKTPWKKLYTDRYDEILAIIDIPIKSHSCFKTFLRLIYVAMVNIIRLFDNQTLDITDPNYKILFDSYVDNGQLCDEQFIKENLSIDILAKQLAYFNQHRCQIINKYCDNVNLNLINTNINLVIDI